MASTLLPVRVGRAIMAVRGCSVLLDVDLAALYGVETRVINQAVRRNKGRFPGDFMFQLTLAEWRDLRSQTVISSAHGGRRLRPYAFTEHGVAMLSSVLRSQRAVRVNIEIMRAFVELRRTVETGNRIVKRLDALERKYDGQFSAVFEAIRQLMAPRSLARKRIGFR